MGFEFDEKNGIVTDKVTGERCIILTKTRMQEIFSRLFETFGSGAIVIWREASRVTGKRLVNETPENTRTNAKLLAKTYVQRFMDAGVGRIEIVDFKPEEAKVRFRVYNNFFAQIRRQEWTACSYIEGLAAGMYEQMSQKTPKITKLKCIGKGDSYCEWKMVPSE